MTVIDKFVTIILITKREEVIIMQVKFQGQQPTKGRKKDVAYDTYTREDILVTSGTVGSVKIPLGFKTEFDAESYGMVLAPRGSFSKLPLSMTNSIGIIEGEYQGEWLALVRAPILGSGLSTKAITLGNDGELTTVNVSEIPSQVLETAKKSFLKDMAIMNKLLGSTIPEDILKNSLFKTHVPTGSVFIKKGSRLFQTFAIDKKEIEWEPVHTFSDSERGEGNLGSSGVN